MGQGSQGYGEGGDKLWTSGGAQDGTGEEASTQRHSVAACCKSNNVGALSVPWMPLATPRAHKHILFSSSFFLMLIGDSSPSSS